MLTHDGRVEHVGVTRHGSDAKFTTLDTDVIQFIDEVIDIDQHLRSSNAQLHHWQHAVAPGKESGFRSVSFEKLDGMGHARSALILKRWWRLHQSPW